MSPRKIQLSGILSKSRPILALLPLNILCLCSLQSTAQCTGSNQTYFQSTTFTTGGNSTYNSTFTKFMPPAGYTVTSVLLRSNKTISPTWAITNSSGAAINVKPGVTEEDFLQLGGVDITDALGNDIGDVATAKTMTTATTIPDGSTVTVSQPNFIANKTMINATIATDNTLLNSFIGTGPIGLTYTDVTGFSSSGATIGVSVSPTFVVRTDFSLTFNYCFTGTLAAGILTFTAAKENDNTVALNWTVTNESTGRKYIVQVSPGNGANFTDVAEMPASAANMDASYNYSYQLNASDNGRLYFRIKLVDISGDIAYSPIRTVDLGSNNSTRLSIYPNPPSDFINLIIPGATQDWQVDIFAADGSLVQRSYYRNANTGKINFGRRLAASTYFVRATSPQTGQHYAGSFLVR